MRPGMITSADRKKDAEALQVWWAGKVVIAGLADTHGVNIRFVELERGGFWGVFIEPHDDAQLEDQQPEPAGLRSSCSTV